MKAQELKKGWKEAKMLQEQCDDLRSDLQALRRLGKRDDEKQELLKRLDKMFSLQCKLFELELSKFGRLKS